MSPRCVLWSHRRRDFPHTRFTQMYVYVANVTVHKGVGVLTDMTSYHILGLYSGSVIRHLGIKLHVRSMVSFECMNFTLYINMFEKCNKMNIPQKIKEDILYFTGIEKVSTLSWTYFFSNLTQAFQTIFKLLSAPLFTYMDNVFVAI